MNKRLIGPVAASMLVIAFSAVGCGESEEVPATEKTQDSLRQLWPAGDHRAQSVPRAPVDHLDPDLLDAFHAAARDAQEVGLRMVINSGWRSRAHQQRLFDEAVDKYGSEEEASRWVSPPDTSAHVTGDAIDIGPPEAADWLNQHGADYGLCQVFANESWHFELATTPGGDCPDMLPDSSYRN